MPVPEVFGEMPGRLLDRFLRVGAREMQSIVHLQTGIALQMRALCGRSSGMRPVVDLNRGRHRGTGSHGAAPDEAGESGPQKSKEPESHDSLRLGPSCRSVLIGNGQIRNRRTLPSPTKARLNQPSEAPLSGTPVGDSL